MWKQTRATLHFTKDYYWVSANNAINLSTPRLFGFVPEDHIIARHLSSGSPKKREQDLSAVTDGARYGKEWNDKQMKE